MPAPVASLFSGRKRKIGTRILAWCIICLIAAGLNARRVRLEKIERTKREAVDLSEAVSWFHETYGRFPAHELGSSALVTEGTAGLVFLNTLLGNAGATKEPCFLHSMHIRAIKALKPGPPGLIYENGTGFSPESLKGCYDAWGRPYHVVIVPDGGAIRDPLDPGVLVIGKHALVYSHGPDGVAGGGDDVRSW